MKRLLRLLKVELTKQIRTQGKQWLVMVAVLAKLRMEMLAMLPQTRLRRPRKRLLLTHLQNQKSVQRARRTRQIKQIKQIKPHLLLQTIQP